MSEKVRFVSTNARLRMVRQTAGEQIMPNGSVAITTPEVVYEFEDGGLTLFPGTDVMNDGVNPENGRRELPQDAIEWIRTTPEYGERIIEVQPEAPDPGPLYVRVGELVAEGDLDGLIALGDAEAGSWNRVAVLDQIRAGVEKLAQPATK